MTFDWVFPPSRHRPPLRQTFPGRVLAALMLSLQTGVFRLPRE